jgi:hemolysin D
MARLKAGLADVENPVAAFHPPDNATPAQINMQREYLVRQTAEFQAKIGALAQQRDQKQAERDTIVATIAKLSAVIPIVQQRVDIRKASSDREYTSKFQYLEMQQTLVEQQQELLVQQSHAREAAASVAALAEARTQAIAEYHRTLFGQLAEAERKADGLAYDVAKSQQKINAQYLTAPIDGTVQQLAIHTVGGVVTPAQLLLAVVPLDSHLEIEAMVPNRDVGFIHPDQQAEIKVDTFNFTKYGLLHGKVLSISQDAIVRDKPVDRASEKSPGADSTSSEPKGQELNFAARVSLDRSQMQIDDRIINLTPGMAVTVEIKTGSRSVMGYLLSPLAKYGHESLREIAASLACRRSSRYQGGKTMRDPFGPPDYQLPWANFPSERSNPIRHLLTWRRLMPHHYFDIKDGHTHAELLLAFLGSTGYLATRHKWAPAEYRTADRHTRLIPAQWPCVADRREGSPLLRYTWLVD